MTQWYSNEEISLLSFFSRAFFPVALRLVNESYRFLLPERNTEMPPCFVSVPTQLFFFLMHASTFILSLSLSLTHLPKRISLSRSRAVWKNGWGRSIVFLFLQIFHHRENPWRQSRDIRERPSQRRQQPRRHHRAQQQQRRGWRSTWAAPRNASESRKTCVVEESSLLVKITSKESKRD